MFNSVDRILTAPGAPYLQYIIGDESEGKELSDIEQRNRRRSLRGYNEMPYATLGDMLSGEVEPRKREDETIFYYN